MTEQNPMWQAISPPAPRVEETARAYAVAPVVRLGRSQRYSLVLTEPLPAPVWEPPRSKA